MNDKYCQAGKIYCEMYSSAKSDNWCDVCGSVLDDWEACPYPSKQKPIEKSQSKWDKIRQDIVNLPHEEWCDMSTKSSFVKFYQILRKHLEEK